MLTSVEIHVEDDDSFEVSPYPIPPINANGSASVYLCEKKKDESSFRRGMLVSGLYGNDHIEIQIEDVEQLANVEEDEYGCSKGQNIGKCIVLLFSFEQLQKYEKRTSISDEEKTKAIELSLSSGVLCKYTGFVGVIENPHLESEFSNDRLWQIQNLLDESMRISNEHMMRCSQIESELNICQCCCALSCPEEKKEKSKPGWFSRFFGKIFGKSKDQESSSDDSSSETKQRKDNDDGDDDDIPLKYDLITISRYQKVDGYWADLSAVQRITGLNINGINGVRLEDKNVEKFCVATIIAIAAIRVKSANEKNSWIMIERKAVLWLKKTLGDEFDIQKVLLKVESLF